MKSSTPQIIAKPAPSITLEQARDARARAWAFVFNCHDARKKAARPSALLYSSDLDEKEKGGKHAEHLTSSPSEVND